MLHESEKLKQKVMTFIMVINGQCPPLTQSKGTLLQPLECSGELNSLFFFNWKRHIDLLIDKNKYKKKDEESSRQRKLNYNKLH